MAPDAYIIPQIWQYIFMCIWTLIEFAPHPQSELDVSAALRSEVEKKIIDSKNSKDCK